MPLAKEALFGDKDTHEEDVQIHLIPRGDVTHDGNISVTDAVRVLTLYTNYTLSGKSLPEYPSQEDKLAYFAADVDQDGTITVSDAQFILDYYARLLAGYENVSWDDVLHPKVIYMGDVNRDGDVNHTDAMLLTRYVNGWEGITVDPVTSDLNGDGDISNADAMILERYVNNWAGYDKYIVPLK